MLQLPNSVAARAIDGRAKDGIGFDRTTFLKDVVAQQRPQRLAAGFHGWRERLGIENDALVHAVFRLAAVNHAPADGQQIARLGHQLAIVQKKAHFAAADPDELRLLVPVHGHAVAGIVFIHVVIGQRKVARAVLYLLMIIQVVHAK